MQNIFVSWNYAELIKTTSYDLISQAEKQFLLYYEQ